MALDPKKWRRSLPFWVSAGVAFVSLIATTCLLIILAVAFTADGNSLGSMTIAAVVVQAVSLLLFCLVLCRESMVSPQRTDVEEQKNRTKRAIEVFISIVFSLLTCTLTIGTLVWMGLVYNALGPIVGIQPMSLMIGVIVTFLVSVMAQTVVYIIVLLDRRDSSTIVVLPPLSRTVTGMMERKPEVFDTTASVDSSAMKQSIEEIRPLQRSPAGPSTASVRSSLATTTHSVSSKSPLIPSRPNSDAVDSWDTSSVPPTLRDVAHSRINLPVPRPLALGTLPTIPGSRPASPAKALDGPFLPPSPNPVQNPSTESSAPKRLSPPPPPVPPMSPKRFPAASLLPNEYPPLPKPSPAFATDSARARTAPSTPTEQSFHIPGSHSSDSLPLTLLKSSYSSTSLAESVSHLYSQHKPSNLSGDSLSAAAATSGTGQVDEEFIHPLFRSTNPNPPPGVTGGTVVTAASIEEVVNGFERIERMTSVRRNTGKSAGSPPGSAGSLAPISEPPSLSPSPPAPARAPPAPPNFARHLTSIAASPPPPPPTSSPPPPPNFSRPVTPTVTPASPPRPVTASPPPVPSAAPILPTPRTSPLMFSMSFDASRWSATSNKDAVGVGLGIDPNDSQRSFSLNSNRISGIAYQMGKVPSRKASSVYSADTNGPAVDADDDSVPAEFHKHDSGYEQLVQQRSWLLPLAEEESPSTSDDEAKNVKVSPAAAKGARTSIPDFVLAAGVGFERQRSLKGSRNSSSAGATNAA